MKKTKNLLVFLALPISLMAQTTVTWDGLGDGTTYEDGGNWGGTAPTNDLTSNIAQLTGGTVDLSTTRQVSGLDFQSGSTLSGTGSIEIGTGGIEVNRNSVLNTAGLVLNQANTTITLAGGRLSWGTANVASGTGALTVTGGNTLYIDNTSAGNTFAGGTTIMNGATVSMKRGDHLGAGTITLDNGTLARNGTSFAVANDITVNSGGGTINTDGNLTGLISGAGDLTIIGQGNQKTIAGGNTLTGNITLDNTYFRTSGADSYGSGVITMKNGAIIKNNSNGFTLANDIVLDASGGGALEAGWTKRCTLSGVMSGDGGLIIRNDSGTWSMQGVNTYAGGTEIQGIVWAQSGSLGTGDVTLNNVHGSRGHLQNNNGATTLDNNIIIDDTNGGRMQAGWNNNLTISGVVSGAGELTIVGDSGTIVLSNEANTYSGNINLQDATSRLSLASLGSGATISGDAGATLTLLGDIDLDTVNSFAGTTTVGSGGSIAGSGSLAGDLVIDAGGKITFSTTETLTVAGTITLDNTFGIDDLIGLDSSTEDGTYTLIANSSDFSNIENWGAGNAYDLGSGKSAYFQEGSLQVVVIPEPATLGMIALFGGGILFIRRRFMI